MPRRLVAGDTPEPASRLADEGRLVRASDLVVASAESEKRLLVEAYGADPAAVHVVAPGVEAAFLQEPSGRDGGRVRIVLLGRIQPLKGQDLAVRMLEHLLGAVLVLAGDATPGDERYLESLHDIARAIGVEGRVRHIGSLERPALARLLDAAEVVVVPSRSESFGLVPLEAAASGTPVVASRVGGLMESVVDGETGERRELDVERAKVQIPAVESRMERRGGHKIGYVQLATFSRGAHGESRDLGGRLEHRPEVARAQEGGRGQREGRRRTPCADRHRPRLRVLPASAGVSQGPA